MKRWKVLILVAVSVFALSGCGKKEGTNKKAPETEGVSPIEQAAAENGNT